MCNCLFLRYEYRRLVPFLVVAKVFVKFCRSIKYIIKLKPKYIVRFKLNTMK